MYQLCDTILQGVSQERYLGVNITNNLQWQNHIQKVHIAANQKLGFLKRNLKKCPKDLRYTAYTTIVRTGLDYAATIWDPHQKGHKNQLEMVQRKAARWICNDYGRHSSVKQMLQKLNLEPLEERRRVARLVLMYKILNQEIAVPPEDLGLQRNPRATRGNYTQDKLIVPRTQTNELKHHFVARTIPDWNRLPESVTSVGNSKLFKKQLTGYPRP